MIAGINIHAHKMASVISEQLLHTTHADISPVRAQPKRKFDIPIVISLLRVGKRQRRI